MTDEQLTNLHKHSSNNSKDIDKHFVGCFYCESIIPGDMVVRFCNSGKTAICPRCGIDSILPSWAFYDRNIDAVLQTLQEMRNKWFFTDRVNVRRARQYNPDYAINP